MNGTVLRPFPTRPRHPTRLVLVLVAGLVMGVMAAALAGVNLPAAAAAAPRAAPGAAPTAAHTALAAAAAAGPAAGPAAASAAPAAAGTAPALSFSPSGIDGGGFVDTLAQSAGVSLAGGDQSGLSRSTDAGGHWSPQNTGIEADGVRPLGVASVAFAPDDRNRAYACTARGVYVSMDAGATWTLPPATPQPGCNSGNTAVPGLPSPHPRSTGNLIGRLAGALYVASFDQGLWRSTDEGRSWTVIALAPVAQTDGSLRSYYLRTLLIHPSRPDTVLLGTFGDGVWAVTGASTATPASSRLPGAPGTVEELAGVGGVLYAAAGASGVYTSGDGGDTWAAANSGIDVGTGAAWQSVAGFVDASGNRVLYAGSATPVRAGPGALYRSVVKSADGGATWSAVTLDASRIHPDIGGPGGPPWWLFPAAPSSRLGGSGYVASQIVVDGATPATVTVAGRSGVWASFNGGGDWYPMVRGLGATLTRSVAVDPATPSRVYAGTTDWTVLRSPDRLATVSQDETPGNITTSVAVDPVDSRVFAASGDRDDPASSGGVWSKPPDGSGAWVDEGYGAASGARRPLGVVAGRDGSGQRVLLAAAQGGGLLRKVGSGGWLAVGAPAPGPFGGTAAAQHTRGASFSWTAGSPWVFVYDRASGVWRSGDYGASWDRIWGQVSNVEHTGYVASDPTDPTTLFVSATTGLFRLGAVTTGASVESGTITRTAVAAVPRPGALGAAAVRGVPTVVVATRSGSAPYAAPALWWSSDHGASWSDVSDDLYRRVALIPNQLAVAGDGRVHVALDGNGAIAGTPPPAPARPPADFDGNGTTDIAVFRPSSGQWFVLGGNPSAIAYGSKGDVTVPADYDGDGRVDVSVFRPSVGAWFVRASSTGADTVTTYGIAEDVPVPADYDGDGRADIAVFRPSTGAWFTRASSTGADTVTTFGIAGDVPVPSDYDGDGRTDVAVFRPSSGTWFAQESSGAALVLGYGQDGDVPVPGDYDADGRTDVAVFRPATGAWFVRASGTGGDAITTYGGVPGDIAVPGDYDGDAVTDIAVFRPAFGLWYWRSSSTGTDRAVTWGLDGDVPVAVPAAISAA